MNNREKLEKWYDEIKNYKQLQFHECKKIALKISNTSDINKKNKLKEELLFGTLYLCYEMFNNTILLDLYYGFFDIEDLINSFIVEWMKVINSNQFLEVISFNHILRADFYNKILANIKGEREYIFSKLDRNFLNELYDWYFIRKMNGNNVNYLEFKNLINTKYKDIEDYKILNLYNCFEEIFKLFEQNLTDESIIFNDNNFKFKEYILEYFFRIECDYDSLELEYNGNVEQKMFEEKFRNFIFNDCKLNDNQIKVVTEYYGFEDGVCASQVDIAKMMNVSHQRIAELDNKALKRIRKNKGTIKFKGGLYEY